MASTFSGIEMGKRSLQAHTTALTTVGHNLSNASTEGYSRQRVNLSPTEPLYRPDMNREERPGQIGQGVDVVSIERIRDNLLENRILAQGDNSGYWKTRDEYIMMVEQVYNEPGDLSVRSLMDHFWEGWQELSIHPEDDSSRQAVLQRGQGLVDGINNRYGRLKEIRTMLDDDLRISVGQVNGILGDISELNIQIEKSQALGDNPNDLLDKRDLLVEKLSGYMNITVDNRDPDEFLIHTSGMHLIQGKQVHFLETVPNRDNEGYVDIVWKDGGNYADIRNGKLQSLVELRDEDLRGEIQKLDMMTINFTDMVNEIHSQAWGKNGETGVDLFREYRFINNLNGNYDRNGDGEFDSSYIFRMTGRNSLDPKQQPGLAGTLTLSGPSGNMEIEYFPADTVEDIVKRINLSGSEVVARLNRNNELVLKASASSAVENPDFVIRHIEDSGQFLVGYAGILGGSGADGAYDWAQADAVNALDGAVYAVAPLSHPSGWIELNSDVQNDPTMLAAGFGVNGRPAEDGDGSAALAIAQLRNQPVMVGKLTSFDDYFADTVAEIGLKGEVAGRSNEAQELVMKDLKDLQSSVSGVNLDEEMADMIKFQHGYAAAARFVSAFDEMLDTIINRMGV
ncbi:MAG: flagellar hook-associated protein FlgK [Calditrichaeota bacterium]|nr:MAG: flagellar hook-associated protein FlgK [Calditrichota bacterium]